MKSHFQLYGLGLKFLRIIHGYSTAEFSKALNISFTWLSLVESGKRKFSVRDTRKALEIFGITDEQAREFVEIVERVKGGLK